MVLHFFSGKTARFPIVTKKETMNYGKNACVQGSVRPRARGQIWNADCVYGCGKEKVFLPSSLESFALSLVNEWIKKDLKMAKHLW